MTPRGRFNLVMGLLVLAALAFGAWRWRQQARDAAAISSQIAAHAAQTARANQPQARIGGARDERAPPYTPPPASTSPMPPWGEPLGTNLDAVRRRADAGDARAACRIGVEVSLCDEARASAAQTRTTPDRNANPTDAGTALMGYCEGIDDALRSQAATYLRKAALAGNTDAMLRYASGTFFAVAPQTVNTPSYLHDPAFNDWYAEALPMAQRALRAGNPMAALLLASAYADDAGLFDARVADDPAQAYAYGLLLSYLRAGTAPSPGTLDPRQRAQAEQQAQKIYRESFGSHQAKGELPAAFTLTPTPGSAGSPCD